MGESSSMTAVVFASPTRKGWPPLLLEPLSTYVSTARAEPMQASIYSSVTRPGNRPGSQPLRDIVRPPCADPKTDIRSRLDE